MERSAQFEALIEEAQVYLRSCQAALDAKYQLWDWPRYDWHQETRQLIFSKEGVLKVIADIQFVGSISAKSDTWLWAWANDSVEHLVTVPPKIASRETIAKEIADRESLLGIDLEKATLRVNHHWLAYTAKYDIEAGSELLSAVIDLSARWIADVWSGRR